MSSQLYFSEDDRYEIRHSCRFESANTAHLYNTPSGDGNLDAFTFSAWIKLTDIRAGTKPLFAAGTNGSQFSRITLISNNSLAFMILDSGGNWAAAYKTSSVFRDFSAWYHICVAVDTGQSTNTNRVKLYVNGTLQALLGGGDLIHPSQNYDTHFNDASYKHWIGNEPSGDGSFDGHMAEINWVDGLQLDPTSFTETDTSWGHLKPKRYTGAYGTNGFHMNFHSSGNLGLTGGYVDTGSNYTVANLTASDQSKDSPSNNFAQWNFNTKNSDLTLSNAGTRAESGTNTSHSNIRATMGMPNGSGKWYCECLNNEAIGGTTAVAFGLSLGLYDWFANTHPVSSSSGFYGSYHSTGADIAANGASTGTISVAGNRSIFQMAYNSDNGQVWFGINNTWYEADGGTSSNPSNGTNPTATVADAGAMTCYVTADVVNNADQAMILNAGLDSSFLGIKTAQNNTDLNGNGDFYYEPPTGFRALCTNNLPTPSVVGQENFGIMTYTGSGSAASHRGLGFRPNLIWGKKRGTSAQNHWWISDLIDINKRISSDSSDGHKTEANGTTFDNDGFDSAGNDLFYNNTSPYVVYAFKGNGTANGVANTDGSIDSVVSANPQAGFSIVKYVGVDSQTTTVGHGLDEAPEIVLVKATSEDGRHWRMMAHPLKGNFGINRTDVVKLNSGDAVADDDNYWNDTAPTTSVFSVGDANDVNDTDCTFIAYCFHSVEGHLDIGVYLGNGASGSANQFDGAFYHTGFRPKWIMIRNINSGTTGDWVIYDSAREPQNPMTTHLKANSNAAEAVTSSSGYELYIDFYANGFKLKGPGGTINADGHVYLFMAFAEQPFKYANAR